MTDHFTISGFCTFLTITFGLTSSLKIIVLSVITVTAFLYHHLRVRKLINRQSQLESKVQEYHELLANTKEKEKKTMDDVAIANNMADELLATLSHEIRTPMNGVIGMTAMLSRTTLNGEQMQYLDSISACSETLIRSINEILLQHADSHERYREMLPHHTAVTPNSGLMKLTDAFARQYPMRILVGEDNKMNQELIIMILKRLGYDAAIAQNGKEIVEILNKKYYDLILMDVQMPEMDGLEATTMIRLCLNEQPVIIAMTANAMRGDREACIRAGMDDYISKPVHIEELVAILEKWALHVIEKAKI